MVALITSDVHMNSCSDAVNYHLWWDFKQMAVDESVTRLCLGVNNAAAETINCDWIHSMGSMSDILPKHVAKHRFEVHWSQDCRE